MDLQKIRSGAEKNLSGANLSGADLSRANLSKTVLAPKNKINSRIARKWLKAREIHVDIAGNFIAWRTQQSIHIGSIFYMPGVYIAPVFSTDKNSTCHPGLYLADKKWLQNEYGSDIALVRVLANVRDAFPVADKMRVRKFEVLSDV